MTFPAQRRSENVVSVVVDRESPPGHPVRSSLATIIPASAAPYGYTLAIWSSGALLLRSHGVPRVGDGPCSWGCDRWLRPARSTGDWGYRPREADRAQASSRARGLLDWLALAAVVGAVYTIGGIHGCALWLLGPLAATILYLVIASVQLAVFAIHRTPNQGDESTEYTCVSAANDTPPHGKRR